jgi:hypothetical protein
MNNQKRQILRTIRSLESVIESVSHILSGDDLDDINWFITTIKKDVKSLEMKENDNCR